MKNFMFIIFPVYLISINLSISSSSWLMIWIGMEMNLLSFIFIILNQKNFNTMESTMKYFLIQSSGSMIFIFSMSMNMIYYNEFFYFNAIIPPLALIYKSGMAPLHSWTPNIVMKFNWMTLLLFITFQKLIPIFVMMSSWSFMMKWIILMNFITGSLGGITQSSMNKMIIFSSINNSSWMIMSLSESIYMFIMFFTMYFIMNFSLLWFMFTNKVKWIIQINFHEKNNKMYLLILMFSLSGLPPFMGFIPKWLILKKLLMFYPLCCFIGIITSVLTMFYYVKLLTILMMRSWNLKKNNLYFKKNLWTNSWIFNMNLIFIPLFIYLT